MMDPHNGLSHLLETEETREARSFDTGKSLFVI